MILQLVCKNLIREQGEEYKSTEENKVRKIIKIQKVIIVRIILFIKFEIKMLVHVQCICINKPLFEESTKCKSFLEHVFKTSTRKKHRSMMIKLRVNSKKNIYS